MRARGFPSFSKQLLFRFITRNFLLVVVRIFTSLCFTYTYTPFPYLHLHPCTASARPSTPLQDLRHLCLLERFHIHLELLAILSVLIDSGHPVPQKVSLTKRRSLEFLPSKFSACQELLALPLAPSTQPYNLRLRISLLS